MKDTNYKIVLFLNKRVVGCMEPFIPKLQHSYFSMLVHKLPSQVVQFIWDTS
jgi:hypothetical protein